MDKTWKHEKFEKKILRKVDFYEQNQIKSNFEIEMKAFFLRALKSSNFFGA